MGVALELQRSPGSGVSGMPARIPITATPRISQCLATCLQDGSPGIAAHLTLPFDPVADLKLGIASARGLASRSRDWPSIVSQCPQHFRGQRTDLLRREGGEGRVRADAFGPALAALRRVRLAVALGLQTLRNGLDVMPSDLSRRMSSASRAPCRVKQSSTSHQASGFGSLGSQRSRRAPRSRFASARARTACRTSSHRERGRG